MKSRSENCTTFRGTRLSPSKTEYRGREATDFKEDDIELFTDIANKVKQTNSYDLAFEELEKEKDFYKSLSKTRIANYQLIKM